MLVLARLRPLDRSPVRHAFDVTNGIVTAVVAAAVGWALSARLVVTPDSTVYLRAARSVARGAGPLAADGGPLDQFPPLYPIVVGLVARVGWSVEESARVVGAASFGATAAMVAGWVRRLAPDAAGAGRSVPAAVPATVPAAVVVPAVTALALAWPLTLVHFVWSEGLYLALVLAAVTVLATPERRDETPVAAVVAGTLLGLAAATRTSGLAWIVVGLVPLVRGAGVRPGRDRSVGRVADAVAVALPVVLLGGAWPLRLVLAGRRPFGPRPPAVDPPLDVAVQAVRGLGAAVVPPGVPWWVGCAAVVAAVLIAARRARLGSPLPWRLAAVPAAVAGVHTAAVVAAAVTTRIDRLDDDRLLVPCAPFLVLAVFALLSGPGPVSSRDGAARCS